MAKALRLTAAFLEDFQRKRAQAAAPAAKPARSKYGNTKVEQAGIKFDSKKEARRWAELEQMERAGLISDLRRQVSFELAPSVKFEGDARAKPAIRYVADAVYVEGGRLTVEDVKSDVTRKHPVYRMKRHLMATVLGLSIREI